MGEAASLKFQCLDGWNSWRLWTTHWGPFNRSTLFELILGLLIFFFPFCLRFVTGLNCMTSLFRLVLESAETPKWNATASLPIDVIWKLQYIHLSCIYACISIGHPEIGLGELREEACASRIGSAARPEAIASRLQRTTRCKRGLPYWYLIPRKSMMFIDFLWLSHNSKATRNQTRLMGKFQVVQARCATSLGWSTWRSWGKRYGKSPCLMHGWCMVDTNWC